VVRHVLAGAEEAEVASDPMAASAERFALEEVAIASSEVCEAVASLVPQLSTRAAPPSPAEVEAMVASDAVHLLLVRDCSTGRVLGMLSLVSFRIPTGVRALIEDVVVDESARGLGLGRLLTTGALALAERLGADTVDLTSRPSREAANQLYLSVGFERRETNVYRYRLDGAGPPGGVDA
jgi:ribosomal protein S18 acetylase RimI-like enzyme